MTRRRYAWTMWAGLAVAAHVALAQENPADRVTIPLSDPSRPGTVKIGLLNGAIKVTGYSGKDVIVEARSRSQGRARERKSSKTEGLHRLADPTTGLNVEEQDNVVSVGVKAWAGVDVILQVPTNTNLNLKSVNDGEIVVENVGGEIDANSNNGAVTLRNISGAVVAHALNRGVLVTFDRILPGKSMSFISLNGDIDVTLPADTKARVKMKTDNGEIYTDFDIQLESGTRQVSPQPDANGRRRLHFDKAFYGSINGGGPLMQLTTFNGKIYIRKKK